jgi:hypothetical protein
MSVAGYLAERWSIVIKSPSTIATRRRPMAGRNAHEWKPARVTSAAAPLDINQMKLVQRERRGFAVARTEAVCSVSGPLHA